MKVTAIDSHGNRVHTYTMDFYHSTAESRSHRMKPGETARDFTQFEEPLPSVEYIEVLTPIKDPDTNERLDLRWRISREQLGLPATTPAK
jgi:hypothetical protein